MLEPDRTIGPVISLPKYVLFVSHKAFRVSPLLDLLDNDFRNIRERFTGSRARC